jgi:hypothetical protein
MKGISQACSYGSVQVVHNYGHGGNGISLSWGTATDATRQFSSLLKTFNTERKDLTSKL